MPLRKQKASIKFSKGVQGKVDHKALPKENLTTLENGRFDKLGAINKRKGYTLVDQACSDLIGYKGSLVARNTIIGDRAAGTVTPASTYSPGSGQFVGDKGFSEGVDYEIIPVSKGSQYRQEDSQTAFSSDGKYACVTFVDVGWDRTNDKKVYTKRASIIDRETNAVMASDLKLGAAQYSGNNGRRMRPVYNSSSGRFVVIGEDEGTLNLWTILPTSATIRVDNASDQESASGTVLIPLSSYPLAVSAAYVTTSASFDVCTSSNTSKLNVYATYNTSASISAATQANPCAINAVGHGFATSDVVKISGVSGMTQLNGNTYTITVTSSNAFTLNGIDSSGFGSYTSGGTAQADYEAYYEMQSMTSVGVHEWKRPIHTLKGHLAIHRAEVTGTHANKLSFFCHDNTNIRLKTCAEAATSYTEAAIAISTLLTKGMFRDDVNPLYSSDQDVIFLFEYGEEAAIGPAAASGQQRVSIMHGVHNSLSGAIASYKWLTTKGSATFLLGRNPWSVGTYQDSNSGKTAPTVESAAPLQTITLWDTDPSDDPGNFSSGVSGASSSGIVANMFNGTDLFDGIAAASSGAPMTVTFEPPIIFSDTLTFYKASGSGLTYSYNGAGYASAGTGAGVITVVASGGGTLSTMAFLGGPVAVYSFKVDGTYLVDPVKPPWKRTYLPLNSFNQEWRSDWFKSASASGLAAHLNGEAVSIPVGHAFERFGTAGDLVLNSTTHLFDFRRYNEERVDVPAPSKGMLHDVLYVADKELFQYDGDAFHAINFPNRPSIGLTLLSYSGSDTLTDGVYYYKAVWEWVDGQGNLHQSEPSGEVTVTANSSNRKVTVTLAALEIGTYNPFPHLQDAYRDEVKIALYRTASGGSIYNHIMTLDADSESSTGYISVVDAIPDTTAATGKFLYTDSGELANRPPPASARYVVAHRDRLFVIGKDNVVYYSKLVRDGFGVAFNEALYIKTPDNISDPPTALGSMDGNLFVFTERSIYLISGEGPDNLGAGGFYEAKRVPSTIGAIKGSPVKLIDGGILFVSDKGTGTRIYLLGRNMSVTHIGASVENLLNPPGGTPYTVRDVVVMPEQETVFFLLSQVSGTASGVKIITFNYAFGQWGIDNLLDTYGAGAGGSLALSPVSGEKRLHIGLLHHATNKNPRMYLESTTAYSDNATYVPMKVKTAWTNLVGIQGYQRVYNFHILGESIDKHTLTVNVYYDYDTSTVVDTYTFSTTSATDAVLQFRGHLSKQKCQAIQFEVVDADNSGSTDEGYTITEIALEIGIKADGYKQSLAKLPAASTVGAN